MSRKHLRINALPGLVAFLWMHCAVAADIQELRLQAADHRWTYYPHVPEQVRSKAAPLVLGCLTRWNQANQPCKYQRGLASSACSRSR